MNKIVGKLLIPKDTSYCYDEHSFKEKKCPFLKYKYNKNLNCKWEYCSYVKRFMKYPYKIKECDINDD